MVIAYQVSDWPECETIVWILPLNGLARLEQAKMAMWIDDIQYWQIHTNVSEYNIKTIGHGERLNANDVKLTY